MCGNKLLHSCLGKVGVKADAYQVSCAAGELCGGSSGTPVAAVLVTLATMTIVVAC